MSCGADSPKWCGWRERMTRFESSTTKVAEFCAAEGVSVASFYAWRRKLVEASEPTTGPTTPPTRPEIASPPLASFRQLVVEQRPIEQRVGEPSLMISLAARLPGGIELELSTTDQQTLRTALSELVRASREAASC